jgi:hypothetical protein
LPSIFILGLLNVEISPSGKPSSRAFSNLLNIFPLRVLECFRQIQFLSDDGRTHFFSGKSQNVHPHFVSGFSSVFKTTNAFTNSPIVGSGFQLPLLPPPPDASLKYTSKGPTMCPEVL